MRRARLVEGNKLPVQNGAAGERAKLGDALRHVPCAAGCAPEGRPQLGRSPGNARAQGTVFASWLTGNPSCMRTLRSETRASSVRTCETCGVEITSSSPSAEFLYWATDGPGGFLPLCGSCARKIFAVRDHAAEVISESPET